MKLTTLIAAAFLLLLPAGAQCASLEDLKAADEQVQAIWEQLPLSVRATTLITEASAGFGVYTPRPADPFKQGETIFTYIEPVGYAWGATPEGLFAIDFKVDMQFINEDGAVLAEKKDFGNIVITSHNKPREASLWLSITPTGAPAGKYKIQYTIRDGNSDESTVVTQDAEIGAE